MAGRTLWRTRWPNDDDDDADNDDNVANVDAANALRTVSAHLDL